MSFQSTNDNVKIELTVEQWAVLQAESCETDGCEEVLIPAWLKVTGNSMFPTIRANRDSVMLVSVQTSDLRIGDIVLFPAQCKGGDYCLHRIYKIDGGKTIDSIDKIQTWGDGNMHPDDWIQANSVLGKAVQIKRGTHVIYCESLKWKRRFKLWTALWRIRPALLYLLRIRGKIRKKLRNNS